MATRPPRLSTAAMTRSAPRLGQRAREVEVDGAVAKQRRADDHRVRAGGEHRLRALDAADPAADAAGQPARRSTATIAALSPRPLRGIEVDQLHARKARELLDPRLGIRRLDRERLALDELDDVAVLEVDRGNQHVSARARQFRDWSWVGSRCGMAIQSRTGMPASCR